MIPPSLKPEPVDLDDPDQLEQLMTTLPGCRRILAATAASVGDPQAVSRTTVEAARVLKGLVDSAKKIAEAEELAAHVARLEAAAKQASR